MGHKEVSKANRNEGYMRDQERLKVFLEDNFSWPCSYSFKLIVPQSSLDELLAHFTSDETSTKESKKGNYISVTAKVAAENSEEIIKRYDQIANIKGLISL